MGSSGQRQGVFLPETSLLLFSSPLRPIYVMVAEIYFEHVHMHAHSIISYYTLSERLLSW